MKDVTLKPLQHRGIECIGIYFEINFTIQGALRKTGVVKFSGTNKCWYSPLSKENYNKIFFVLKGLATIEQSTLHQYLANKKSIRTVIATKTVSSTEKQIKPAWINTPVKVYKNEKKAVVNAHVIPAMHQHLKLKAYSQSTTKTYLNEMSQLLNLLKDIPADLLTPEHLKRYLVYCYEKLHLKENTLHSRINAMKFYYEQVLGREKFFWEIPRPKKQLQLPRFFNQEEITAIIKSAGNVKHKTMLMLAYASGLRVSEVVKIRTKDIDSRRMCILVQQAKGKKDRMVTLSPVLLVMLREYYKTGKPSKEGFLFPGQYKDEPYSSRSLQLVLAAAKKKAGVLKPGSIHALRHSFATHLLDKGTDVTMIMKLLGHNDIKTTLRYLHVSNRDMLQVMSPLDDLNL
jgi:integrase/recombinase XerD